MATFGSSGNYKLLQLRMTSLPPESWQESYKNYQELIIHQDSLPNSHKILQPTQLLNSLSKVLPLKKKSSTNMYNLSLSLIEFLHVPGFT